MSKRPVYFYLDPEIHRRAKIEAATRGISMTKLIEEAIRAALASSETLRAVTPYDNQ